MISVIIHDSGEPNVIRLTYENLYKELKDIKGFELLVSDNWFEELGTIKNDYICFVESDCLVSPGFFKKQIEDLTVTNLRRIAMLTSVVSVTQWDNYFYGYNIVGQYNDSVVPITQRKSSVRYPVQIGYFPGAIIRKKMLMEVLKTITIYPNWNSDLVFLSAQLSMAFWRQGQVDSKNKNGNLVYINPGVKYLTTEDYVNDIGQFNIESIDLLEKFSKESI